LANEAPKTLKGHTFDLNLSFEQIDSHWKVLDEQKTMVTSGRGFEMVEENKYFNTPYLKKLLRGLGVLQRVFNI